MALDLASLSQIVSKIAYRNWVFQIHPKGDGYLIQAIFTAPDAKTGTIEVQKCRKWYCSSHASEGEVVRTIYKAVEAAEIHEVQENFRFCGQAIFNPHLAPEDLALLIAGGFVGLSVRSPMPPSKQFETGAKKLLSSVEKPKGTKPKKPRKGLTNGSAPGSTRHHRT